MTLLAGAVVALLWALIAYQTGLAYRFWQALQRSSVELVADNEAPPATVVLCLRGTDPFLEKCLHGLLSQDYPDYSVRIVVDGPHDSAHRTLRDALAHTSTNRVKIENLLERFPTCSLKCSALYQAIDSLDPRCEIVAQIDADTVPHPTWLRELATALKPADVGTATGNRWYMPSVESFGAIVRYVWNAAAVTQMLHHKIAWGGTMATKAEVFRNSDLLTRWRQALCEDAMMHSALAGMGLRMVFVPSLMMVNREDITISSFFNWIKRQMLIVRHYHPAWRRILVHIALSIFAPLTAVGLMIMRTTSGNPLPITTLHVSLNCFALSFLVSLLPLIGAVRRIVGRRGEPTTWVTWRGVLKMFLAFPLTPIVYAGATIAAAFARYSDWRGIRYHIDGPWNVRMEQYIPYRAERIDDADHRDQYKSVA